MKPWHLQNPEEYKGQIGQVRDKYPSLHEYVEGDVVFLRGTFPVKDPSSGQELDRYWLEIEIPQNFPTGTPVVRETGGRIPRIHERHVNPADGSACLFLAEKRVKHFPEGATLLDFIDGPVFQFFLSQSSYELNEEWLFGEWGHGAEGIAEYYGELLDTDDARIILNFVLYLSRKKLKGHWNCYCEGGKKIRNCHYEELDKYRQKIPRKIAKSSYESLRRHFSSTSSTS